MVENKSDFIAPQTDHLLAMCKRWRQFVILGILLILIGLAAATYILAASLTAIFILGSLLFAGGIFQIAVAFQFKELKNVFQYSLISGILLLICSLVVFIWPEEATITITILIGITFIIVGILRILSAVLLRGFGNAIWVLVLGILDLCLATLLFMNVVGVAILLPGFILACALLFHGMTSLMTGLALKKQLDRHKV